MIYAFMTLKNTYADKKIYLWNVNRDSIGMFTALAFRRIPVDVWRVCRRILHESAGAVRV